MEVRIIKNMVGIARNNELEFQRPLEHHPFWGKGHMLSILLQGIFYEG
jgi:hypothetical protein